MTDGVGNIQEREDLSDAYAFSAAAHEGHTRKGSGDPYIAHPEAVAEILLEAGVDEAAILRAALLHDVVENNTKISAADIAARFGDDVAELVVELTRPQRTHNSREEFRRYLVGLSPRAAVIKVADRIENVRGLRVVGDDPAFVREYLDETRELFLSWAAGINAALARRLQDEFARSILHAAMTSG